MIRDHDVHAAHLDERLRLRQLARHENAVREQERERFLRRASVCLPGELAEPDDSGFAPGAVT